MTRLRRALLGLLLVLGAPIAGDAWGIVGHHLVARGAIAALPEPLRAFFSRHGEFLETHSIDPDLWREQKKPGEGPNHFLDMDAFEGEIDRDEATHLARRGQGSASKGRVPWRAVEALADLTAHFKARDEGGILEDAAVVCHYVGDSHVPFHATENYDGQLSGQKGIHARWESVLVERNAPLLEAELHPAPAATVADPLGFLFDILKGSLAGSREALASDKASLSPGADPYADPYYDRFFAAEKGRILERLQKAATATASLWLTAWEAAGRPALPSRDPAAKP
jgi:hypothetical protein